MKLILLCHITLGKCRWQGKLSISTKIYLNNATRGQEDILKFQISFKKYQNDKQTKNRRKLRLLSNSSKYSSKIREKLTYKGRTSGSNSELREIESQTSM